MTRAVPDLARKLAGRLDARFAHDAALARRLNDAQRRVQNANDRLWRGAHPDGLAAVYGEHPAAVDVAFGDHRSGVLGAADPLAAIQQVHRQIHRAFIAYQTVAEERRQLAAEIGELVRQLVDALLAADWTEEQVATPTSTNSPPTNQRPTGGTEHGNDPDAAIRDGWHAPRPTGDRGACPGKPRPAATGIAHALDARPLRCRLPWEGR